MDETVLPAIALAKRESTQDRLTDAEEQQLHSAVLRILTQALNLPETPAPEPAGMVTAGGPDATAAALPPVPRPLLLGWPLDGPADDAALQCLALHLPPGIDCCSHGPRQWRRASGGLPCQHGVLPRLPRCPGPPQWGNRSGIHPAYNQFPRALLVRTSPTPCISLP